MSGIFLWKYSMKNVVVFMCHLADRQPALGHWRVQLRSPTLLKMDVIGYVFTQKFAKQIFCDTPAEAYSEPSRTSKMGLFTKIVNGWKPLNIFAKRSIVDVRQGSESVSDLCLLNHKLTDLSLKTTLTTWQIVNMIVSYSTYSDVI